MIRQRKTVTVCLQFQALLATCCLFVAALLVAACGNVTGTIPSSGMATVNTMISDPATCAAPDGPYAHVYVTITDVLAHTSASAGDNDGGWVDLAPNLKKTPKQVDMLGQANNQCFLASLGDAQQLQAGTYQQIRIILADNSLSLSQNLCSNSANCVVLSKDSSTHTLLLSSESKTGLKIPSGQIAKGGFTIAAGETKDLDIDFNTCSSIVREGNGQFRLKPVLHAGEVSTTSASINGKVLDKSTGNAVIGSVTVNLEQKDKAGIDRIVMSAMAGVDGTFVFCPLPAGTYDIVVVGTRADGAFYDPTIVTGVTVGSTTGTLNLHMPATPATSGANLTGLATSQNAALAGTAADVALSSFETVNSVTYTIPLPPTSTQTAATAAVETAASTATLTCPTGTYCASYTLQLPSGGPYAGAWSASGPVLAQSAALATYVVDGIATTVPSSGGTLDCNPSELQSTPASALTGVGPYNVAVSNLAFLQCQ